MAKYAQLTCAKKTEILAYLKVGLSMREISKRIGCSHSTVVRFVGKYRETGSVYRREGSGPSRKTTSGQDRLLRRISLQNRFKTAVELRREFEEETGVNISVQTVRRRLQEGGLWARKAAKKPLLTSKMKSSRLSLAKKFKNWTSADWKMVVFSDESRFCLFGPDGSAVVRRRRGERFSEQCVQRTVKHSASCMIWGCFSYYGIGRLHFINGSVDANKYLEILQGNFLPSMEEHLAHCKDIIFQDDSAPCHRASKVKNFLKELGVNTLEWPGNSPDLHPIENLWAIMKREIRRRSPSKLTDLKKPIENVWYEIIQENLLQTFVASMPNRINAVIKSKGGPTKY